MSDEHRTPEQDAHDQDLELTDEAAAAVTGGKHRAEPKQDPWSEHTIQGPQPAPPVPRGGKQR